MDEPVLLRPILLEKVPCGGQEATSSEGFPHPHPCIAPLAPFQKQGLLGLLQIIVHSLWETSGLFVPFKHDWFLRSLVPASISNLTELKGTTFL